MDALPLFPTGRIAAVAATTEFISGTSRYNFTRNHCRQTVSESKVGGKVIWITGASSGIGEALAKELSAQGAQLVLSSRREAELRRVQAACQRADEHLVLPLDMLDTVSFGPATETVLQRFGHVDILIHCAGISQRAFAVDTQLDVDRRIMDLNYFGPVALTKQVLPSMVERRFGRIVVISSLLGKIAAPARSAYCASKHALHGFFDALRAEEQRHGIAVTIICPGFVHTSASLNALTGDGRAHGKMDELTAGGMASDACARRIVSAIKRGRREVYIGRKEVFAVYLSRWAPGLFHRFLTNTTLK
jgi:short-subunit dehydrogenase